MADADRIDCNHCKRSFKAEEGLFAHCKDTHSCKLGYYCCDCNREFGDAQALEQHNRDKTHHSPALRGIVRPLQPSTKQPKLCKATAYCKACKHDFKNAESLQQHMDSPRHRPLSDLTCPLSKDCRQKFTTPSALIHHAESGRCRSGIDRATLNALIIQHDQQNAITRKQCASAGRVHEPPPNELREPGHIKNSARRSSDACSLASEWSFVTSSSEMILTPSASSEGSSMDGKEYFACPLCPDRHPFTSVGDLHQHLLSAAHAPKIFHCPVGLDTSKKAKGKEGKKCKSKDFSTLSGLTQHIEAGACKGGKSGFKTALKYVERELGALGFGGLRVLL
ncbi:hypothetical protein K431DRAFT_292737 [Polychaeton citri CBS 116435]|uniref:C2H2-type domain-containing protein n=1 Tax=Polychaeton citri CBS 116435 TaxID=1314669 RepID=A0A9P4QA04_9PEZI|nr:hypothetical protein K431DRAFT_292737 [Polychaeton citri CBS 116435]